MAPLYFSMDIPKRLDPGSSKLARDDTMFRCLVVVSKRLDPGSSKLARDDTMFRCLVVVSKRLDHG